MTDSKEEVVETATEVPMSIVKRNMLWSGGVGLLPIPMVEFIAITAVQVKLIKELSDHYDVPFRKDLAKKAVISLLGGLGSVTIGHALAASSLRAIPFVGPVLAAVSLPAMSAGAAYAVGKVFIAHYEAGGTLLSFNPEETRDYFKSMYDEGVKKAGNLKNKVAGKKAAAAA
ncbi:MAG: DUF697 domain-containing protein [Kordiimonadaceae bacterium]|nr:DUF697 domain-containing protein [Kordiimonadaceae bacterium]